MNSEQIKCKCKCAMHQNCISCNLLKQPKNLTYVIVKMQHPLKMQVRFPQMLHFHNQKPLL